jgi:hypothetical protein
LAAKSATSLLDCLLRMARCSAGQSVRPLAELELVARKWRTIRHPRVPRMRVFRRKWGLARIEMAGATGLAMGLRRPKLNDELIGLRFGRLVIRSRTGGVAMCRCDCRSFKKARIIDLKRGSLKSCGCGKRALRNDLAGRRFGRLTALRAIEGEAGRGHRLWLVRCDCGNEPVIAAKSLASGNTRSCGCLRQVRSRINEIFMTREPNGRFSCAAP